MPGSVHEFSVVFPDDNVVEPTAEISVSASVQSPLVQARFIGGLTIIIMDDDVTGNYSSNSWNCNSPS